MSVTPHRTDFENTTPVWLIDLEWGGEVWRVATQPVVVLTSGGRRLSYLGGMEPPTRLRETLGRLDTDPGSASASVSVVLPVNVAERVSQGHSLLLARATIYMGSIERQTDPYAVPTLQQQDHQLWHLLEGVIVQPRWALKGAPAGYIQFQVKQAPWNESSLTLIPSRASITEEDALDLLGANPPGTVVPLVFGRPGEGDIPGSPCYWIGQGEDWDIITAPWAACNILPSKATTATLRYLNGTSYVNLSKDISRLALKSGLPATVIDVFTAGTVLPGREAVPAWVIWDGDGGASASPYSSDDLRDSAEVAAYCLEVAGFRVDVARWLAIKGRNTFNVDTYVNDAEITAWDWLEGSKILKQMAISVRRGAGGVYPVPYSPDIYASRALASITEARDWIAASPIEAMTEITDVINSTSVQFKRSAEAEKPTASGEFVSRFMPDSFQEKLKRIAESAADTSYTIQGSHQAMVSASRYGGRSRKINVETFDAASAESVALRMLSLNSLPTFTRSYTAPWSWGWLNVGDAIQLTDADASWSGVVAIINEKVWTGAGWGFEVLVDEMLIRDARPF